MYRGKKREAWTKVINRLKEMSYMYDKKHKLYFNRKIRHKGYKILLEVYTEEIGIKTDLPDFKKKLENLRTSYIRELKKVNASKQSGCDPADIYEPSLWYYNLFEFLEGTVEPWRPGSDTYNEAQDQECEIPLESEGSTLENNEEADDAEYCQPIPTKPPAPKKQKMALIKKEERLLDSGYSQMTQKITEEPDSNEEWGIIGKSIGLQMKDISRHQLVIVQKIISDAIYYGRLGKLTEESHITLSQRHTVDPLHLNHPSQAINTRSHFSMTNQTSQPSPQLSQELLSLEIPPQYVVKLSPPS